MRAHITAKCNSCHTVLGNGRKGFKKCLFDLDLDGKLNYQHNLGVHRKKEGNLAGNFYEEKHKHSRFVMAIKTQTNPCKCWKCLMFAMRNYYCPNRPFVVESEVEFVWTYPQRKKDVFLVTRAISDLFEGVIGHCLDLTGDSIRLKEPWVTPRRKMLIGCNTEFTCAKHGPQSVRQLRFVWKQIKVYYLYALGDTFIHCIRGKHGIMGLCMHSLGIEPKILANPSLFEHRNATI